MFGGLSLNRNSANNLLNEAYIWSIIYQLTSALVYCHCGVLVTAAESEELPPPEREQTVLHRDIKPANGRYSAMFVSTVLGLR